MGTPNILVVGSLSTDLTVKTKRMPKSGETVIDGIDYITACGGKGANQAVQASRLGAEVTLLGKIGNDINGKQILESIKASGINTEYIIIDKNACSGMAFIILEKKDNEHTENRIIVVPGANMEIQLKEVNFLKEVISKYNMVMLEQEIPAQINEAVAHLARKKGIPVMLNPAPSRNISDALLKDITYISPNEHEAADITGVEIKKSKDSVDLRTVKEASNVLLEKGAENVIITLGDMGASYMNKDEFIYLPCVKIEKAADPTAAGDSFIGAFCTGICSKMNKREALKFASYAAAMTVSRIGAQPSLPYYDEIIEFAKSYGDSFSL